MFFYGFILVQFGAIDFIWKGLEPGSHLPFGPLYPAFTFFQEIVTLIILVAVVWAFYRRYIEKLVRLKRGWKNGLVLIFIGGLMLSYLVGNGMGMIWQGHDAYMVRANCISYRYDFRFHATNSSSSYFLCHVVGSFINLINILSVCTTIKACHLIAGPANVYFHRLDNVGRLRPINFEEVEDEDRDEEEMPSFGVGKIQDFTQAQMIDLYACVECGRCTNMCPATGTGKMLSPMDLIVKLRDHLTITGAVETKTKTLGTSICIPRNKRKSTCDGCWSRRRNNRRYL